MWTFETLVSEPTSWLAATGPRSDVILSTRVRVARNLDGHSFPNRASDGELNEVRETLLAAMSGNNYLTNALVVRMEDADEAMRNVLAERHLVSGEFVRGGAGKAVVIGEAEVATAMVNEEDHLRLQCIRSGLMPTDAWRLVDRIESEMDRNLHYAFSSDWGYLTACPTNAGTGLRVSVLAHLIGLARERRIGQILGSISKLGLTVRGYYGEGSLALGGFFQISNQTTLGQSEEDIAYTVERVAGQLTELELESRDAHVERRKLELEDEVHRAFGLLTSARLLTADEVMERCSSLRLGIALGLIEGVSLATVNRLLVVTQPGHLAYARGSASAAVDLDAERADLVRRELAADE
jgi:protein arginine kinase